MPNDIAISVTTPLSKRMAAAKILVVEDVEVNRFLVVQLLQKLGYQNVQQAENGKTALLMVAQFNPDLIILDLKMPVMDGFEFCSRLRRDQRYDHLPIIALTMLTDDAQKVKVFELGASDYITKPVQPGEMACRVRVHLEKKFLLEDLQHYQQRISQELSAAREIQARLLPNPHYVQEIERRYKLSVASRFIPSSELGGDNWGLQAIDENRLAFYMYDFSGHGVAAALNVIRMHTLIRDILQDHHEPSPVLGLLNGHLGNLLSRGEFSAMFYAVIDTQANTLSYSASSFQPPLIVNTRTGECTTLDGSGIPLGGLKEASYPSQQVKFEPGFALLAYSDALVEDRNIRDEVIPMPSIYQTIAAQTPTMNAENIVGALVEKYRGHTAGHQQDDLTLAMLLRPAA